MPADARARVSGRSLAFAAAAFVVAAAAFLFTRGAGGRPLVILVSIDTLRADRLGCYGYERPTSPAIDAFCRDAVVFRQAIAQAPSTLPSHASMLTSLLPHEHKASVALHSRLPDSVLTLTEVLRANGYATASFNGYGQLDPVYGLDQGFDLYERAPTDEFASTVKAAIRWLKRKPRAPSFLFLHTYETHHPYTAAPRFLELFDEGYAGALPARIEIDLLKKINRGETTIDARDLRHVGGAYDAEIRSMDESFADLVRFLRKAGLYDDALIVLTSDHGEELGEHGKVGWHSHSLYDELLRVPFVMKLPGSRDAGRTFANQVRSIDIAPTILGVVGIAPPAEFRGRDLLDWFADGAAGSKLTAVSERDARRIDLTRSSLRTEEWKVWSSRLFDLARDPAERTNVAALHPEVARSLEASLVEILARGGDAAASPVEPSDETRERLRALGYVN